MGQQLTTTPDHLASHRAFSGFMLVNLFYASYFIPSSVQLWNQQPENIKSSRSVQIIKSNLQPQNNTKSIYYYIGTRLGQILHARLRMQCSSLNHHLFRTNIVNSPFCQCGATETTAHFLLHCSRHNATRLRYIHTINLPGNAYDKWNNCEVWPKIGKIIYTCRTNTFFFY